MSLPRLDWLWPLLCCLLLAIVLLRLPLPSEAACVASATVSNRWPNATIPWSLHQSIEHRRGEIEEAVAYVNKTFDGEIVWRPVVRGDTNYAMFISSGAGGSCSSYVGRSAVPGVQLVYIGAGCGFGNIVHEMGHVMGAYHEHVRPDRDEFIRVNYSNIQAGAERNFDIPGDAVAIGPYDLVSIMHYGPYAFAKDTAYPTITRVGPAVCATVGYGQRLGLSSSDKSGWIRAFGGNGTVSPAPPSPPGPDACTSDHVWRSYRPADEHVDDMRFYSTALWAYAGIAVASSLVTTLLFALKAHRL